MDCKAVKYGLQFANILTETLCLELRASHYSGYCLQVPHFRAQQ